MTELYDRAIDALRELADALSDMAAEWAGDYGATGHKTPGNVIRIYEMADVLEIQANRELR